MFLNKENNKNESLRFINAKDIKLYLKDLYKKIKKEKLEEKDIYISFDVFQNKFSDMRLCADLTFHFCMNENTVIINMKDGYYRECFSVRFNPISLDSIVFGYSLALSKPKYKKELDFLCVCSDEIIKELNKGVEDAIESRKKYEKDIAEVLKQRSYH